MRVLRSVSRLPVTSVHMDALFTLLQTHFPGMDVLIVRENEG